MLVHHALPYLRQAKGRVINISTGAGSVCGTGLGGVQRRQSRAEPFHPHPGG